jgi:haloalkane dehalogenase
MKGERDPVQILRTPDARFEKLPGYPFEPHYSEIADGEGGRLRIHHVDEGPTDAEVVLCLHGQPTWSYLYRKMIPVFVGAGLRVIAPDFVGFGRSDKPTERSDYTYARHVAWMSAWLEGLDLRGINLFCQDWGGLIGLRLVAAFPERFARVVAANTALPDGAGLPAEAAAPMRALYESLPIVRAAELGERFLDSEGPPGFLFWRKYCAESPDFSIGDIMQSAGGGPPLSDEIRDAYEAPFPDERFVAGARQFPSLVPVFPDDPELPANRAAWQALAAFDRPFGTSFSDSDPVTAGLEKPLQERIAGAKGVEHVTIEGAGHFLQEEQGELVAEKMLEFMRATPVR